MKCLYEQNSIMSILEDIEDIKYITYKGKLYKFFVKNNNLTVAIYDERGQFLYDTYIVEPSIKGDFDVYSNDTDKIHVVMTSKKYNLIYIFYDSFEWIREEIYRYKESIGIPSTPMIKVYANNPYIILLFIKISNSRAWSLRSYIKSNSAWNFSIIDKSLGLCYCQPHFVVDKVRNIHVVYRLLDNYSSLKYSYFSSIKGEWGIPKIIRNNAIDKYRPYLFINRINKLYICWIEIINDKVYICCSDINMGGEYFKADITEKLSDTFIFCNGEHIYRGSFSDRACYYDLCCNKKVVEGIKPNIIDILEDENMGVNVRLFLDIKRELENQIAEFKKNLSLEKEEYNTYNDNLIKEYEKIKQENVQKENEIHELSNNIEKILREKDEFKRDLEQLQVYISQKEQTQSPDMLKIKPKISLSRGKASDGFIKKILEFMKKDA